MTDEQVKELNEYIERYARKQGCSIEEAKKHKIVKFFEKYVREKE